MSYTSEIPHITRLRKVGGAHYVAVNPRALQQLGWNTTDVIAARVAGTKLILERVALEKVAQSKIGPDAKKRIKQHAK